MLKFRLASAPIAALLIALPATAQVYTSSQFAAPYVQLAGGTAITFLSTDDDSVLVPIGFPFPYFGQNYTMVNVATNGNVVLAAPCSVGQICQSFGQCVMGACEMGFASTSGPGAFPNVDEPNLVLAPFWDDLLVTPPGQVLTGIEGTAPNRTFVVEWRNVSHFGGVLGTANFQVRLSESGVVRLAWGPFNGTPLGGGWTGDIGVENANGTVGFAPNQACVTVDQGCSHTDLQALNGQVLEVGLVQGPELIATISPPPGAEPGQPISVGVTARNVGTQATPVPIVAHVYLSVDTTITPGVDTYLGEVSLPVIPSREARTATLATSMPGMLMPATYRIGAIVDATNLVMEASEQNNTAVSGEFLIGPDLLVSVTAPQSTGPSEPITFPLVITNRGAPVQSVYYEVFLSTDTTLDVSDTLVVTGTAALAGRPSMTFDAVGTVPANIIPVAYYAIAVVDPDNGIIEISEMNNSAVSADTVDIVGPDVAVTEITGDGEAYRGQPYTVRATLRNLGGTTAQDFFYTFYLSDNQLVTATDPVLCEFGPIDLAPGGPLAVEHVCTVPTTIAQGPYYLGAIADSTTVVLEGDERNNIRFRRPAIQVRDPAPDLVVQDLSVPALAAVGEAFAVGRTIDNIGNAPAAGDYTIHLSTNSTYEASDFEVGRFSASLAAFSRDVGVDQPRIPQTVPAGLYYVIYRLDPDARLTELDETNNVGVSGSTVRVEAAALQILTRSLPQGTVGLPYQIDLAAVGGTGAYTWSVLAGSLPAGITLDAQTGRIRGAARAPTQTSVTVRVADGTTFADATFALLIAESTVDLDIITRAVPPAFVQRRYEVPLTAIGGIPPYVWTYQGPLPAGLLLSEDGVLSGTPTMVGPATVNFRVNDAAGTRTERPITVRVVASEDALRFTTDVLRDGERGRAYEDRFRATNGQPPYTFELIAGEVLPPGLDIDGDKLVGTPTITGTYVFGVRVTDQRADFDTNRFVITIDDQDGGARFVSNALPEGVRGVEYLEEGGTTVRLKAVAQAGIEGALEYTLLAGDLPPGITLGRDGVVSGTPTAAGLFTFTAQVIDRANLSDRRAFSIVVGEPPPPPPPTPEPEGCSCASASQPSGVLGLLGLAAIMVVLRRRRSSSAVRPVTGLVAVGLAIAGAALAPRAATAQVPYFLQEELAPYAARSGTPLTFVSNDDSDVVLPLPFGFRFFNTTYNDVNVGTNGYVAFGESARSLDNNAFGSPSTPNNLIALFWDDLFVTSVQHVTEGVAPNRTTIIQWVATRFGGGGNIEAQLWLYEGPSGRFEIRYGNGSGANFSAAIGFEDGAGATSRSWRTCSPGCTGTDLAALSGTVLRALQDGGPDVTAVSVTGPARVFAGAPFPVTGTFTSLHQNAVGPFDYGYQLFPAVGPQVGVTIGGFGPVTLTPYQTLSSMDEVTIPVLTPPGQYRIALVIDPAGTFPEPDERNNVVLATGTIEVGERRPDFTAGSIVARPAQANPGDTVSAVVQIRNAGNLPGSTEWRLVLSGNRVISIDDAVIHTASVTLPLLGTMTATVPVTIPATLEPGRYYLGVLVDPDDDTLELSEVNNAVAARDPIEVGVDFVEVATEALPGGYVGVEYSTFLRGAGGDGTYVWALTAGALPPGLNLLPMAGELRGTPTAAGAATFTAQVTSAGRTATKELTIAVAERGGPLTIVTRALLPGVVGAPYPPPGGDVQRLRTVNASGDVVFRATGSVPTGLELSPDGLLSGVPRQRGVFDISVEARDSASTATRTIPLTIVEPGRLTLVAADLPEAVIDDEYRFQLQALGSTATVTFTIGQGQVLPDGLSLTSAGLIIGVPQRVGTWRFSVTAADGAANDAANFTLVVLGGPGFGITPSSLPVAVVGTAYDATLEARGGTAPLTWRIVLPSGSLPRGIRFEVERTGARERLRFLGTPEAVPEGGVVSFLATVEDVAGRQVEQPLAIRVTTPPPPPPPPVEPSGCDCATGAGSSGDLALALGALAMLGLRRRRGR